jgi:hypothetical protein
MITVWVKTLEEIKDRIKSNPDKQFKLAYLEDPKSNREILTLLDKDGNTIYCFLKQITITIKLFNTMKNKEFNIQNLPLNIKH